jgi:hypothetical protein
MRTVSQFVVWAHREGYPLDRDRMFIPDAVERYIAVAASHLAVSSRATRRSDLRRFSRQITTKAPWAPDPPQLRQRRTLVPFTQDEITRLWEIARTRARRSAVAASPATSRSVSALDCTRTRCGRPTSATSI